MTVFSPNRCSITCRASSIAPQRPASVLPHSIGWVSRRSRLEKPRQICRIGLCAPRIDSQ